MDDTSKLPEWPETPDFGRTAQQEIDWLDGMLTSALARMEALVECLRGIRADRGYMVISGREHEIDYLLAACERKEAGR